MDRLPRRLHRSRSARRGRPGPGERWELVTMFLAVVPVLWLVLSPPES